MRSLDMFVLVVVLQSLEEQRSLLFCRVEQPTVTGPSPLDQAVGDLIS